MDAGKGSAVELNTLIQNLSQVIFSAARTLATLDFELNKLECLNQLSSSKSRKLTKTSVLKFMYQIVNRVTSSTNDSDDEIRRNLALQCAVNDLKTLLTCIHAMFKKQHEQIHKLTKEHQRRKSEGTASQKHLQVRCEDTLDRVSSSNDLLNSDHASSSLNTMLDHSKVDRMCALVLPNVFKYLSTRDIKACWVVNKSWRKAVNNYFLSNPTFVATFNNVAYKRYMQTHFERWHYMERFSKKMESYKTSGKNPFPTRSLFLREQTNSLVLLEAAFQRYLSWAGPHVHYFTLCASKYTGEQELEMHEIDYFMTLGRILGHLPNLISLKQYTDLNMNYDGADDTLLQQIFSTFPLPNLPHLKNIRVDGYEGDWVVIVKKYAEQLVKLDIMKRSLYPWNFTFHFPNLMELYIKKLVRTRELINSIDAPLLQVFRVDELDISSFGEDARFKQVLFTIIRKFPNLKHLKLLSNAPVTFQEVTSTEDSMYVPKCLETLELKFTKNISFSLLLKFLYLQHLHLHKTTLEINDDGEAEYHYESEESIAKQKEEWTNYMKSQVEVVELQKYHSLDAFWEGNVTIYDSNIWEILPFLRTLTIYKYSCRSIDKFVCTRERRDAFKDSCRRKEKQEKGIATIFNCLPFHNENED